MTLSGLAQRIERAEGADRELFEDIWREVFPKPGCIWEDEDREEWTAEYSQWIGRQHTFYAFLDAEAWLDAAMTLVPNSYRVLAFSEQDFDDAQPWAIRLTQRNAEFGRAKVSDAFGATPALALCAASIRARIATEGE